MISAYNEKAQVSIVYSQRATTPYHSIQFLPVPSRKHQPLFCDVIESGSFWESRIKANAYSVCQNDCFSVSSFYTLLICGLCLFGKSKVLLVLEAKKMSLFPFHKSKTFLFLPQDFLKTCENSMLFILKTCKNSVFNIDYSWIYSMKRKIYSKLHI